MSCISTTTTKTTKYHLTPGAGGGGGPKIKMRRSMSVNDMNIFFTIRSIKIGAVQEFLTVPVPKKLLNIKLINWEVNYIIFCNFPSIKVNSSGASQTNSVTPHTNRCVIALSSFKNLKDIKMTRQTNAALDWPWHICKKKI